MNVSDSSCVFKPSMSVYIYIFIHMHISANICLGNHSLNAIQHQLVVSADDFPLHLMSFIVTHWSYDTLAISNFWGNPIDIQ